MDRQIIYPGAIPLETDLLNTNKNTMIALSKIASALFGSSTFVNGLTAAPNSPAALNVVVSAGELYSLQNIDGTAYSSLAADTTHSIVKQGVLLDPTTLSTPAPGTAGQSINYLIQAAFSETDTTPVVLPYYNASNPTQAYSGPSNTGSTNNTVRKDTVLLSAKAGIAATTGSQTTPTPDAGYVGLYVVTVANGQSTVTSANISQYVTAPILPAGIVNAIQQNAFAYGVDTGSANVYAVNFSPAITSVVDGMVLHFRAKTANTGASTFSPNGLTASPIWGGDHAAVGGGEIIANGDVWVQWNSALNGGSGAWLLIDSTGGYIKSPTPTTGDRSNKLATTQMFANEFSNSLAANGWTKLPNGIIIQWGSIPLIAANSSAAVTFPIAFPNQSLAAIGMGGASAAGQPPLAGLTLGGSKTGATFYNSSTTAQILSGNYIALGN